MFSNLILAAVILLNPWSWKILLINPLLFLLVIFSTFTFAYVIKNKKFFWVLIVLFSTLAFFQWKTTTSESLTLLDNDEQRIKEERIKFYAPGEHYVRVIFKRLDLINFLEGDLNTVSKRLQRNFFETIDPNVYFFGGHPRERVWANDFEKLPFVFIIPFLIGLYNMILDKKWFFFLSFSLGVMLLSAIGHKNLLGPFILFPVIVILISGGLVKLLNFKNHLPRIVIKPIFMGAIILILLSIIQTFVYAY